MTSIAIDSDARDIRRARLVRRPGRRLLATDVGARHGRPARRARSWSRMRWTCSLTVEVLIAEARGDLLVRQPERRRGPRPRTRAASGAGAPGTGCGPIGTRTTSSGMPSSSRGLEVDGQARVRRRRLRALPGPRARGDESRRSAGASRTASRNRRQVGSCPDAPESAIHRSDCSKRMRIGGSGHGQRQPNAPSIEGYYRAMEAGSPRPDARTCSPRTRSTSSPSRTAGRPRPHEGRDAIVALARGVVRAGQQGRHDHARPARRRRRQRDRRVDLRRADAARSR